MFLKDGKFRGSSGSPVINKGGYVVGFHTDSFNEPTVPIPKEDGESVPERMEGKRPSPPPTTTTTTKEITINCKSSPK